MLRGWRTVSIWEFYEGNFWSRKQTDRNSNKPENIDVDDFKLKEDLRKKHLSIECKNDKHKEDQEISEISFNDKNNIIWKQK